MLTSFFLDVIYIIVNGLVFLIELLPDVTVDSGLGSAIDTAVHYVANYNSILPITQIFTIFGLVLTIELGVAVYKIVMWTIRRFPTQS
ncbi:hypothetical protein [Nocardia mangyaensis]|uniref:hypothetical protein n=1 Tax=Nocardia mangyaensis TaxID=2213200 RepID=UPI00267642DB|nr:hypothetical protein [Nocardia mangyaensis]